jgi:hypothetical protein
MKREMESTITHSHATSLAVHVLVSIGLLIACAGCTPEFGADVRVEPKSDVPTRGSAQLLVRVKHPPRDARYRWHAERGVCKPEDTTDLATTYTAPSSAGQDRIGFQVVDGSKQVFADTVLINVVDNAPPLLASDIERIRSVGLTYAAKFTSGALGPAASSLDMPKLRPFADQLWRDGRYEEQAPHETALLYRLYATTLLFTQSSDPIGPIKDALPWLSRAVKLDTTPKDYQELKAAVQLLQRIADGKLDKVDARLLLSQKFRIGMPEADAQKVEQNVDASLKILVCMLDRSKCDMRGNARRASPADDFKYFASYRVQGTTIGQRMDAVRTLAISANPGRDVGGKPVFFPLPNGNTKVIYHFSYSNSTQQFEWEVNKDTQHVLPLTEPARAIMQSR